MSLGEWQIAATVILGVGSPLVGARLAVRRIGEQLDNARLDELRGLLDDIVVHVARADRLARAARGSGFPLDSPPDSSPLREESLALLDAEIDEITTLESRISLRLGFDHRVTRELLVLISSLLALRNSVFRGGEHATAVVCARAVADHQATFLEAARILVGPSSRALEGPRARTPRSGRSA